MLPAECFVNSQKFQEAKVHKGSSLGLPDHTAISRHNFSALDREAAEANTVGQLTCLPEHKQTPKQTYIHTPNTHTYTRTRTAISGTDGAGQRMESRPCFCLP